MDYSCGTHVDTDIVTKSDEILQIHIVLMHQRIWDLERMFFIIELMGFLDITDHRQSWVTTH